MKLNVPFLFLLVQLHYKEIQTYLYGENRIDDNVKYLPHQDIVKAIRKSKPAWFYGYSYALTSASRGSLEKFVSSEGNCTFFTKQTFNKTNVHFTKHEFEDSINGKDTNHAKDGENGAEGAHGKDAKDRKEKLTELFGTFFNSSIRNLQGATDTREICNGIMVTSKPGEPTGKRFKLLYSDYWDCAILRPLKDDPILDPPYDQSYYANTPKDCVLLLSESAVRGSSPPDEKIASSLSSGRKLNGAPAGMPILCQWAYLSMCGESPELKVVFNKNCPHIPNALGC